MKLISKYFVSILGIGFFPFAPGTIGSMFAIFIWYLSINYFSIYFFWVLVLTLLIISIYLVNIYLEIEKKDDPSEVVIDEFIGQSIPLLIIFKLNFYEVSLAFLAFRIFDIFKIYPIDKAESIDGAAGVILDDIIAGIYALIVIILFRLFISI